MPWPDLKSFLQFMTHQSLPQHMALAGLLCDNAEFAALKKWNSIDYSLYYVPCQYYSLLSILISSKAGIRCGDNIIL